ncbi:eukaryotic translation initiation factor 3 subunit H [Trichonephila clavipes]|nr:eukaryotic translation initiation factor 3 subunit H [Trichonephila clavipes]
MKLIVNPRMLFWEKRKSELVNVNISEELVPWYAVRFSKYNSIVRLMGWILRFINNSKVHVEERKLSELSLDDIENAERVLIWNNITGIDLAGPLFTRDGGKVWIVLYTCAIYRAIHLELVSSLSTECFMLSLRWFIARRTRPETIYTDNGTNFVSTNSELKNLDWDKIMQETDIKPIKWKFNPPTAGWWERLVRVIKELLKRTLDLDLSGFSKFQKRIKYRRKLIHDFRSRFRKEYLGQLRQKRPGRPGHDFKVDVVMIEEPSKKRAYWPLGKVISLLPGRDGKVRTLKLKCKNSELIRPIQRVYPLEVPFINNEIVKIDGVPTSSVNEDKLTSNAVIKNKAAENNARSVKGEPPLPDDDINKLFKPIPPPSRLDALLVSGQIDSYCKQISQFSTQNLAKFFMTEALYQK